MVANFLATPALQSLSMSVAFFVSKHCVTTLQPLPVPCVHVLSAVGQLLQLVAVPPALNVAPVHWLQVKLSPVPLTMLPAFALNAVLGVAVFHVDALAAVFFNTPLSQ